MPIEPTPSEFEVLHNDLAEIKALLVLLIEVNGGSVALEDRHLKDTIKNAERDELHNVAAMLKPLLKNPE